MAIYMDIVGIAPSNATVTVNGNSTYCKGEGPGEMSKSDFIIALLAPP
jgi:hypothetical protein